ncbi:hypothetical protein NC651_015542 [Populus alba x Populus x berolinensis]|nr:hypothetical protein NC651_015542 [Populus alba x Populus x berolinensis]
MKGNKSRFGLRSRLMGFCFSTDNDKIPQERQRLSSKGNQEAGHDYDHSPTISNGPEVVEIKRTSSIPSIHKNVTDLYYILGEGGFGAVYKGVLDKSVRPGYKTIYVAIKELNPDGLQGDREWLVEVNYLGQLSHQNLVKLIGYCCEDEHRLLVYEYMASGSLEKHLFRSKWLLKF